MDQRRGDFEQFIYLGLESNWYINKSLVIIIYLLKMTKLVDNYIITCRYYIIGEAEVVESIYSEVCLYGELLLLM